MNELLRCEDCRQIFPSLDSRQLHNQSRLHKRTVAMRTGAGVCEICEAEGKVSLSWVYLTVYGVRKHLQRLMCDSCIALESRGEL